MSPQSRHSIVLGTGETKEVEETVASDRNGSLQARSSDKYQNEDISCNNFAFGQKSPCASVGTSSKNRIGNELEQVMEIEEMCFGSGEKRKEKMEHRNSIVSISNFFNVQEHGVEDEGSMIDDLDDFDW